MVGSPSYMAPEQIRGLTVGPPADLYALAVVLYEAMTARRLFPVNNYEALLRSSARRDAPPLLVTGTGEVVPADFNRILQTALAQDPKDRYPDARTMLLSFEQMQMTTHLAPVDLFSDSPGSGLIKRPDLRLVQGAPATPSAVGAGTAPTPARKAGSTGRMAAVSPEAVASAPVSRQAPAPSAAQVSPGDAETPAVEVTVTAGPPTADTGVGDLPRNAEESVVRSASDVGARIEAPVPPVRMSGPGARRAVGVGVYLVSAMLAYALTRVVVG